MLNNGIKGGGKNLPRFMPTVGRRLRPLMLDLCSSHRPRNAAESVHNNDW